MAYTDLVINAAESYDADNLSRTGNEVLLSPRTAFGSIDKNEWVRVGYFDPADDIAPTTNTNTTDIKAQNPTGGPDILLLQETTEATAIFESIAPLTPSNEILELHAGAPAVPVGAGGITVSPFTIGATIGTRMIVVKRRLTTDPDRIQKVYWFPNVGLASNGTVDKQNRKAPQFRGSILTWDGDVVDAEIDAAIPDGPFMGQVFNVPNSQLDAFLTKLMAEAPAA